MKADTKLEFDGVDAFIKVYRELGNEMRATIGEKAVRAVGKVAVDAMNFLVPVRTGTLKNSLGLKTIAYKKDGRAVAMFGPRRGREFRTVSRKGKRSVVNFPTKYAHLVEFGFINRNGEFIPPKKAFLRPAIDAVAPRAGAIMARTIEKEMKRVAAKHRRGKS